MYYLFYFYFTIDGKSQFTMVRHITDICMYFLYKYFSALYSFCWIFNMRRFVICKRNTRAEAYLQASIITNIEDTHTHIHTHTHTYTHNIHNTRNRFKTFFKVSSVCFRISSKSLITFAGHYPWISFGVDLDKRGVTLWPRRYIQHNIHVMRQIQI